MPSGVKLVRLGLCLLQRRRRAPRPSPRQQGVPAPDAGAALPRIPLHGLTAHLRHSGPLQRGQPQDRLGPPRALHRRPDAGHLQPRPAPAGSGSGRPDRGTARRLRSETRDLEATRLPRRPYARTSRFHSSSPVPASRKPLIWRSASATSGFASQTPCQSTPLPGTGLKKGVTASPARDERVHHIDEGLGGPSLGRTAGPARLQDAARVLDANLQAELDLGVAEPFLRFTVELQQLTERDYSCDPLATASSLMALRAARTKSQLRSAQPTPPAGLDRGWPASRTNGRCRLKMRR